MSELEALQRQVHRASRERMLRELAEAIEVLTAEAVVVLVLEDLQWSDASTIDWLAAVARRRGPARLLVLGTYRPADVSLSNHPLKALKQELLAHGECAELWLRLLTIEDVERYLSVRYPQQQFPPALGRRLH
ncbi:MAG: transcriptional regulator, partial [Deltaproteobacteria bacterium]|nr:transcriptional regulator [Deltaproteobacteria bacterium]